MKASYLAVIAAELFTRRQQKAAETIRNRGMSLYQAEAHLRPWLAIACLCGADLPELAEPLAERVVKRTDGSFEITDAQARGLIADEICPRSRWAGLLARARDKALDGLPVPCPLDDPRYVEATALNLIAEALAHDPNGRHPVPAYMPLTRSAA